MNVQKYETYKSMHESLSKALKNEFYYEAIFIEYAILENNGQLSFLTSQSSSGGGSCYTSCSSNTQPLSSASTNSSSQNTFSSNDNASKNKTSKVPKLPIIYVLDGHVNKNALTTSGKNKVWIEHELKKHHINSIKDVLIAMTDTEGKFYYQLYDKNKNKKGA